MNHETRTAAQWLEDNDDRSELCHEMAKEIYERTPEPSAPFTRIENATVALADGLKRMFANQAEEEGVDPCLEEVSWYEIALPYIAEIYAGDGYAYWLEGKE